MRSSIGLAIGCVVCAATAFGLWRELGKERERADALAARVTQLERAQAAVAAQPDPVPDPPAAQPVAPAPVEAKAPPAQALAEKTEKNMRNWTADDFAAQEARLMANPKYRDARRQQRRLELVSGHLDLAQALGISQETADRLIDWMVESELQWSAVPRPNPRNEEELRIRQRDNEQLRRAADAQLAAILGGDKVPAWKEYQASLQVRHHVHDLRAVLSSGPDPLREDQMEPLIAAVHAEQKAFKEEDLSAKDAESQTRLYYERMQAMNERAHASASSILSSLQLKGLDAILKREYDRQQARTQMIRAINKERALTQQSPVK